MNSQAEFLPAIQNYPTKYAPPVMKGDFMTFHQFVKAVEFELKEVVGEEVTLSIYEAEKNNGVKRVGITFSKRGVNLAPTIYLEEYYEKYLRGWILEACVGDILRLYYEVQVKKSWDEEILSEFHMIEDSIVYRLVNADANKELLTNVPYVPYMDLAIVFYIMLELNEQGSACMLIRNEHLDMWGIDEGVIFKKAKENTWRILPSDFRTMRAIMKEFDYECEFMGNDILYVLTNQIRSFGAAVILYEGCLEMIAEYLDDNYYVLPSSVHEVIIVPEKDAPRGKEGLSEMVDEINRTQVEAEEILSDIAYYYDREKKILI